MADTTGGNPSGQKMSSNIDKNISKQKAFNKELEITVQKANAILKAFGMPQMGAGGGGGAGNITTSGTFSGDGGGGGGTVAKIAATALGVAAGAASTLPGVKEVLNTQLLTSQARFTGVANATSLAQASMRGGQAISSTDSLEAMLQGGRGGLLGNLPGYSGIMGGVSQLSNLTGSQTSAMRAAVGLNSAQSVNTMRMFGISVRGSSGAARPPNEVFKDIYNFASNQIGRKLTPEEVAIGLQPGNGLANFLDAAAAGNSDLRNALQLAAQQYAKGGDLSRSSTNKTGATTAAQGAQSDLYAAKLGTETAAGPSMSKGFIEGADLLSRWNGQMANALRNNKLAQDAVKQLAKAETLAADQIGQGILSILGVIGAAIGGGGLLAKFKSMFKGGKGAPTAATAAEATANTGKVVIDPVTGAASHSYSPGTAAAQAGSKAGIAGKALGPLAIFFMGKELIKESDPRYEMDETQSLLSALLGNQYVRKNDTSAPQNNPNYELDKTQGFLDKLLHGKRFVISGSDKGSTGLGLDASVSGSSTSPSNAVSTNSVIGIAMSQQGTPYSWGGGSIAGPTVGMGSGRDTVGFDCSSFTRYVMGKVGVVLPRTAREQQQVGTQINPKDAQPGDLLFWGMPAHHVAIYIGNDMMIEAPSTGDVVKRTGVNLSSVTSCSRVLNNKTGTTGINNILHAAGGYSAGGNYGIGSGSEPSQQLSINDLRGSSPKEAMSGGTASSSGLGLGDSSSPYGSYSSSSVNKQYLTINQQSGKLESNDNSSGTVINYGGVTVEVNVPKGASLSPQELSKAIKEELKTLPISVKVARS